MVQWRLKWQCTSVLLSGEPHEQDEKAKDIILEDEPPVPDQMFTRLLMKEGGVTNSSRNNEEAGPKQKWHSVLDVSDAIKNNIV